MGGQGAAPHNIGGIPTSSCSMLPSHKHTATDTLAPLERTSLAKLVATLPAGVAVGCVLGGLLLGALATLCWMKRRRLFPKRYVTPEFNFKYWQSQAEVS